MKIYPGPRATILCCRILTVVLAALGGLSFAASPAHAQCPDPSATRPILFVHGFTGSSTDWGNSSDSGLRGSVISQLSYTSGYSNSTDYDLYFDGANVRVSKGNASTDPIASTNVGDPGYIPCDSRFFSIKFYGWAPTLAFDPLTVAQISDECAAGEPFIRSGGQRSARPCRSRRRYFRCRPSGTSKTHPSPCAPR
jgi:hypothetical protein